MPTSTLKPGDERQDDKLNPGQIDYDRRFNDIANAEKSGNANSSSSLNSENTLSQKEGEGNGNNSWQNNFTNQGSSSTGKSTGKGILKGSLKKKGPLAAIIGVLGIGGISITMLFSPGLLIVQLKETMANKFNSQLSSMTVRSNKIMVNRLKDTATSGTCSVVNIRCKFSTMSKKQLSRLEKAGITALDKDGKPVSANKLGRARPAKLLVDGQEIDAKNLRKALKDNPGLRSSLNKVYNPKFSAFSDGVASKLNSKLKISKRNSLTGSNKEGGLDSKMKANVSGDDFGLRNDPNILPGENDGEYIDKESGRKLTESEINDRKARANQFDIEAKKKAELSKVGGKVAKSSVKGAFMTTALGAGAVDTICTGYQTIRAAGFAAKYIGMLQLSRYAMTFMTTADAIKAGDATPEQVEYLGNILTSVNSKGQSATDSYGYKYAAYGDVGGKPTFNKDTASEEEAILADETLRYTNGQLVPKNVLTDIITLIDTGKSTSAIDSTCGFVKSGWGQTILLGTAAIGIGVAIVSGGTSLGWGAVAQIGASASLAVAMALVAPKLVDMATGTLVTGSENGNEAGNAITSGMGAYNAQVSQARGLAPLTKEDAIAYQNLTNETIALYEESEKLESSHFDITNPNTFVGSFAAQIVPNLPRNTSSIVGSILGSFSSATTSLFNSFKTSAADAAEFSKCEDTDYQDMNLAADPFCNIQYGMNPTSLEIDPEEVVEYMVSGSHVDEMSGEPTSSDFKEFIKYCVDRENPIGGYSEGESGELAIGSACIEGNASNDNDKYTMFRLYLIDKSIIDGMDGEESTESTETPSTSVPDGTEAELAGMILSSGNVVDSTGQLKQIVDGSRTNVKSNILQIIASLSSTNKFRISSLKRDQALSVGAGSKSLHLLGGAVDISGATGVNGVTFGYSGHNAIVQSFIDSAAAALSAMPGRCEVGVPNQTYVNKTKAKISDGCYVFVDTGTAPHIHLGVSQS